MWWSTTPLRCQRPSLHYLSIISREHSEGGAKTTYRMVDVSDLPVRSDYFLVSTSSQAGQTKKLTF